MGCSNQTGVPARPDPLALGLAALPLGPTRAWRQRILAHTLHCSSSVAGSAAQFNQSVSAMPSTPARTFHALPQGTADTLLLRWAVGV